MDLSITHVKISPFTPVSCQKCELPIDALEYSRYIRFSFGDSTFIFDEDCFEAYLVGVIEFYRIFIRDRRGEKIEVVN